MKRSLAYIQFDRRRKQSVSNKIIMFLDSELKLLQLH